MVSATASNRDHGFAASTETPKLLEGVENIDSLTVGNWYRWMHTTSNELTAIEMKFADVGGAPCCGTQRPDNVADEQIEVRGERINVDFDVDDVGDVGDDGAFEMVDFQQASPLLSHENNWFYSDTVDDQILHGPFSLVDFKSWMEDGHFAEGNLVRHGRSGESVPLSDLLRVAEDGERYTKTEFITHYGGTTE